MLITHQKPNYALYLVCQYSEPSNKKSLVACLFTRKYTLAVASNLLAFWNFTVKPSPHFFPSRFNHKPQATVQLQLRVSIHVLSMAAREDPNQHQMDETTLWAVCRLSEVRSRSGPEPFCRTWTRTPRSGSPCAGPGPGPQQTQARGSGSGSV